MVRSSLTDLPKFLWAECYNWAVYIRNRLPHSALKGRTPFEVMFDKKPTIKHLRLFGAHCLVQIPVEKWGAGSKLSPRALEGGFVGYIGTTHMFCIYIPSQRKVDTYRQVQFIPSNDTTSLEVYLPSDVTLTYATPTATSQTPPLPSTLNIPNQPSTPPHGRMPGTFSPKMMPKLPINLPVPPHRITELDSDDESDSDSERVSSQLLSEAQRSITPPAASSSSQPPLLLSK